MWPEVARHSQQFQRDRRVRVRASRTNDACRELLVVPYGATAVRAARQGYRATPESERRESEAAVLRGLGATGVETGVVHGLHQACGFSAGSASRHVRTEPSAKDQSDAQADDSRRFVTSESEQLEVRGKVATDECAGEQSQNRPQAHPSDRGQANFSPHACLRCTRGSA